MLSVPAVLVCLVAAGVVLINAAATGAASLDTAEQGALVREPGGGQLSGGGA